MATVRDIAKAALRKLGVLSSAENLSAADGAVCLEAFQGMLDGWCRDGMFGRLRDVHITADYTAREFQRIRKDAGTVTIPTLFDVADDGDDYGFEPSPSDIASLADDDLPDPSHRVPRNRAVIVVTDPATDGVTTYFYEGDRGEWVQVQALTLDSTAPLSSVDKDGLACCLALLVADEFGVEPRAATVAKAARFRSLLTNRLDSTRRETPMQSF